MRYTQEEIGLLLMQQQQENEQRDYHQGMAYDVRFEIVAFVGIGRADYGLHRSVFPEQGRVHAVEGPLAYPFLVYEIAAGVLHYRDIRLGIHPGLYGHLVEHVGSRRHHHHSGMRIQGDVGICIASHIAYYAHHFRRSQIRFPQRPAYPGGHRRLYGIDLLRH